MVRVKRLDQPSSYLLDFYAKEWEQDKRERNSETKQTEIHYTIHNLSLRIT